MANPCIICKHPKRVEIDLAIARRVSYRVIAARFGLPNFHCVYRHRKAHLPPAVLAALKVKNRPATAIELEELRKAESESLLANLIGQRAHLWSLCEMAEQVQDVRAAAMVHSRITENLKTTGQLLGDLANVTQHNNVTINQNAFVTSEAYLRLRAHLMKALQPFPEARRAVAAAMATVEGGPVHFGQGEPKLIEAQDARG